MSFICLEIVWLQGMLGELGIPQPLTPQYQCTKYIEKDYHSIHIVLNKYMITRSYIFIESQMIDVFTKTLCHH